MDGKPIENDLAREAAVLVSFLLAEHVDFVAPLAAFHAGQEQAFVAFAECLLGLAQERVELLFVLIFLLAIVLLFVFLLVWRLAV